MTCGHREVRTIAGEREESCSKGMEACPDLLSDCQQYEPIGTRIARRPRVKLIRKGGRTVEVRRWVFKISYTLTKRG